MRERENMQPTLGDLLRKIREKSGKNQTDFAKALGIVVNTISAYERSERLPEIDFLIKVSITFNEDLAELIKLRVMDSTQVEVDNVQILTFLNQIKKNPYVPGYPNFLAKEQLKNSQKYNFNSSEKSPVYSEISKNQLKICYQAYCDYYQFEQPKIYELTNLSNVVGIYNLIVKLYPVLGLDHANFNTLEPIDVSKIMDALNALRKIPSKNEKHNLNIE